MNQDNVEDNADNTGQDSRTGERDMIHSEGNEADASTINTEDQDRDSNYDSK